ncbi:MAG: Dabb family protein [Verrucomicrobiae bacterium]|nr:Dabb family protein [Verrucomicrobiae bacterium]
MFSHVVIFWTDPAKPAAADDLVAGAKRYLNKQPGILHFHVGKMAKSHRDVVDQSYQVALNIVFDSKASQDAYQDDPAHVEFIEKVFRPNCRKVLVYDFE